MWNGSVRYREEQAFCRVTVQVLKKSLITFDFVRVGVRTMRPGQIESSPFDPGAPIQHMFSL